MLIFNKLRTQQALGGLEISKGSGSGFGCGSGSGSHSFISAERGRQMAEPSGGRICILHWAARDPGSAGRSQELEGEAGEGIQGGGMRQNGWAGPP